MRRTRRRALSVLVAALVLPVAIRVSADSIDFLANGKVVKAFSKAEMHNFSGDGQAGIRVNHNLDVHVDKFQIKRGK